MSVILAIAAALILVVWGMMRERRGTKSPAPVLIQRFVHPGHSWLRLTEDGDVLVGIDDFGQSVIGALDEVRLPRLLRRVKQGRVAFHLRHGKRVVPIVSPVSGWVVQKNESVLHNPGLVNTSPYGEGWLIRIHPRSVSAQLPNLFTGQWARRWQEIARARLAGMFSGTPALMFQDGGTVMADLADRCSDVEWKAVEREIFLVNHPPEN